MYDIVVDDALSWDHTDSDVGPGAHIYTIETRMGPMSVAVIRYTMDTEGNRDGFTDADKQETLSIARDAAYERYGKPGKVPNA